MIFKTILSWATPLTLTAYILASLVGWFLLSVLHYGMGSGQLGRGKWWVFECIWEGFLQNIPGGMQCKVAKLKQMVGPASKNRKGYFVGYSRSWSYEELRSSNDYEVCAKEMFGGPLGFWLSNSIAFLLGSIAAAFFGASVLFDLVMESFR